MAVVQYEKLCRAKGRDLEAILIFGLLIPGFGSLLGAFSKGTLIFQNDLITQKILKSKTRIFQLKIFSKPRVVIFVAYQYDFAGIVLIEAASFSICGLKSLSFL